MKKGQFTITVIIALLILVGVGVFIYYTSQPTENPEVETEVKTPVASYVSSCTQEVARQGLERIGRQGGYVNSSKHYSLDSNLPTTEKPYLQVAPDSESIIPYWHYLQSSNECSENCRFESEAPTLQGSQDSIQAQLERYVDRNVENCIANFSSIQESKVEVLGQPRSRVEFLDNNVQVKLNYPLRVKTDTENVTLEDHTAELDVAFKRLYKTAIGLNKFNTNVDFFENSVSKSVLNSHSMGLDPEIPPMQGGVEFDSAGPWYKPDVREKLKTYLNDEMSKVSVEGTVNSQIVLTNNTVRNAQNDDLYLPGEGTPYSYQKISDLAISFEYLPWWDLYLDITGEGSSGQFIRPQPIWPPSLGGMLLPLRIENFNYDLSYPVMATVSQPNAFGGDGYELRFAVESNLRNNDPLNSSFSSTFLELQSTGTYLCDQQQRNSGDINITVENEVTGERLEGASIQYSCGSESCYIDETNSTGFVSENLPVCGNGLLTVNKPGFGSEEVSLTTQAGRSESLTVELMPEFEVEATVMKKMLGEVEPESYQEESTWNFVGTLRELERDETAIIVLRKVDSDYTRVVEYNGSGVPATVSLSPGTYELEGHLTKNVSDNPVVISEKEVCEGVPGFEECVVLNSTEMNKTVLSGGLDLSGENSVDISASNLQSGSIRFYVAGVNVNDIDRHLDMTVFGKYPEITGDNSGEFKPEFTG